MAQYRIGDMLSARGECDFFIITTNSTVNKQTKRLVMGRGIARQIRDAYPGIDRKIGYRIYCEMPEDSEGFYGLLLGRKLGAFQVKRHYADKADLNLIQASAAMLERTAKDNPDRVFFLNYPGIGNGKLSRDQVQPLLERLPNNVVIWTKS